LEIVDIYQTVTDQIVAMIESGQTQGQQLWHRAGVTMPKNALTGKFYRGINVLSLWATAMSRSYDMSVWATYRQWTEMGAQVRKGEKSALVIFYKDLETENPEDEKRIVARASFVFNCAQVEGYTAPAASQIISEAERIEVADQFLSNTGANIQHGGDSAYFAPSKDQIQMPEFSSFVDPVSYYAVALHELTHWSGHKSRLDRDLSGRFKSESYAAEELVAELGAAFLCASMGLTSEPRADHAHYIQHYLRVLKDDKRAIFTAASAAQKAADFLWSLQPAQNEMEEAA
jgi:antirestriction protein ArdC